MRGRRRFGRLLLTAATPLALTLLFARPAAGVVAEAEETGSAEHHRVTNPIENFATMRSGGQKHGHEGHETPPPFGAALLNFGVLAFLVGRFAGPSFTRFVKERHHTIARQLDESTRLAEAAQKRLGETATKLGALDADMARLVAEIRAEAEAEKQRILAEATARAERMQRDAEQQIRAETQRARATLEREAVLAAVAAAERLLRERFGDADQRVATERFVRGIEKETTA